MLGGRYWRLPYGKTQAYFYMVAMGILIALISSVLDHAATRFANPWVWVPLAAGVFGVVVSVLMGAIDTPSRADLLTYTAAMVLLMIVGVVGAGLHVQRDLGSQPALVIERFLRGAPFLAPLLFTNMGLLGLIVLLDPAER
jgi:hypothetical protein